MRLKRVAAVDTAAQRVQLERAVGAAGAEAPDVQHSARADGVASLLPISVQLRAAFQQQSCKGVCQGVPWRCGRMVPARRRGKSLVPHFLSPPSSIVSFAPHSTLASTLQSSWLSSSRNAEGGTPRAPRDALTASVVMLHAVQACGRH